MDELVDSDETSMEGIINYIGFTIEGYIWLVYETSNNKICILVILISTVLRLIYNYQCLKMF